MRRQAMYDTSPIMYAVIVITCVLCAPIIGLAGGTTHVTYKVPNPVNIPVSWLCASRGDCKSESGSSPKIEADIVHTEAGVFCDKVLGGHITFSDVKDYYPAAFFRLDQPRCNFGPSNYSFYNPTGSGSGRSLGIEYFWGGPTRNIVESLDLHDRCMVSRGRNVTFYRKLHLTLELNDADEEQGTINPQDYIVEVNLECPKCKPLSFTGGFTAGLYEGVQSYYNLDVLGGFLPLTYGVVSGTFPPGLTLDSSTGKISGIPQTAGPYNFTITISDKCPYGSQTMQKTFNWNIPCWQLEFYSEPRLPDAKGGTAYSYQIKHNGRRPFAYRIVSGVLPQGLSLNVSTGVISGTPPKKDITSLKPVEIDKQIAANQYAFTVRLSDSCAAGRRDLDKNFVLFVKQDLPKIGIPAILGDKPPAVVPAGLEGRADIAVTDISLDAECRLHVKYGNIGTVRINQSLRQQVWGGNSLVFDAAGIIDLLPGASIEKVMAVPKPAIFEPVATKVVIDSDKKLQDVNRANNTMVKTLRCGMR